MARGGLDLQGKNNEPNSEAPHHSNIRIVQNEAICHRQARKAIVKIIKYIDIPTPANELTYQMYSLASSAPEHLASLLERLIVYES